MTFKQAAASRSKSSQPQRLITRCSQLHSLEWTETHSKLLAASADGDENRKMFVICIKSALCRFFFLPLPSRCARIATMCNWNRAITTKINQLNGKAGERGDNRKEDGEWTLWFAQSEESRATGNFWLNLDYSVARHPKPKIKSEKNVPLLACLAAIPENAIERQIDFCDFSLEVLETSTRTFFFPIIFSQANGFR